MTDAEKKRCPQCGAELSSEGLCASCLMKQGLAENTEGFSEPTRASGGETKAHRLPAVGWQPLTVEQIQPYFPELEILELLGRGGMGAVYKARQKNLDRYVALKILPPQIAPGSVSFAERFTREAQALARLSHPHIVTIHDFGMKQGTTGLYFFVMEYVDGLNLRQVLDSAKMSPDAALAIVPQICEALQYAHDQGIVHRDIKPENILLNKQGRVKIADFGLAKLVGASAGLEITNQKSQIKNPALTEAAVGTPNYMAPEQRDHPSQVDHRADIYALGVVFYQMLTGELPKGRFEPPSKKVQIDVRLDEVVLRALEREPSRRYQHVSEIQTEVETIVSSPLGTRTSEGAADKETSHNAPSFSAAASSGAEPRFSRTAIVGAVLAVIGVSVFFLGRAASLDSSLLVSIIPIATATLCGIISLSQIRRSAGRLYGLGLALFDALLFPLLALDGLIAAFAVLCVRFIASKSHTWADVLPMLSLVCLAVIILVDAFIIRRAWRAVNQPIAAPSFSAAASEPRVSGGGGRPRDPFSAARREVQAPSGGGGRSYPRRRWLWPVLIVALLGLGLLVMFLIPQSAGPLSVNTSSSRDKAPPAFGPVIEREIPYGSAIDFASGRILKWPDEWRNSTTTGVISEEERWIVDTGVAASAEDGGLLGHGTVAATCPVAFENAEPQRALNATAALDLEKDGLRPTKATYPVTRFFRTREGAVGILQILGVTDPRNPRGVKIRYKLVQTVVTGQSSAGVQAKLSDGVTVELVGVSENPSRGHAWWRPDGSPLHEAPYPRSNGFVTADKDHVAREFAVRLGNLPADPVSYTWAFDPGASSAGGGPPPTTDGNADMSLRAIAAEFPADLRDCTVRFGLAAGPWKTVAKSASSLGGDAGSGAFTYSFAPSVESDKGVTISVAHNLTDVAYRIVAIDKEYQIITGGSSSGGSTALTQTTVQFPGLHLAQVDRFELQTRPYEWVEFQHVSLQADHKTEPTERVIGNASQPAKTNIPSATPPAFGPVIERNLPFEQHTAVPFCIDFDSAKVMTVPPELDPQKKNAWEQWSRENGVDAFAEELTTGPRIVSYELGCVFAPVASDRWESLTPEQMASILQTDPQEKATTFTQPMPSTFVFKTREGGMGILQIVEVLPNKFTKIRYKMVQDEKATGNAKDDAYRTAFTLLREVINGQQQNLRALRQWTGDVTAEYVDNSTGQNFRQRLEGSFLWDRTTNRIAWTGDRLKGTLQSDKHAETTPAARKTVLIRDQQWYEMGDYPPERAKGETRLVRIFPASSKSTSLLSGDFDPRDLLMPVGGNLIGDLEGLSERLLDPAQRQAAMASFAIKSIGDNIIYEEKDSDHVRRYVFDRDNACALRECSYREDDRLNIQWIIQYARRDDVVLPTQIVLSHHQTNAANRAAMLVVWDISTNGVNRPMAADTFSLKLLGAEPGDYVRDQVTDVEYRYDGKGGFALQTAMELAKIAEQEYRQKELLMQAGRVNRSEVNAAKAKWLEAQLRVRQLQQGAANGK